MWYRYYPQYSQYYVLVSQSLTVEGIRGFVTGMRFCISMPSKKKQMTIQIEIAFQLQSQYTWFGWLGLSLISQ